MTTNEDNLRFKASIVIPIYNEEGNVIPLHTDVKTVCEANGIDYEIIMVDDGSSDNTVQEVLQCEPVTLVRLRKNFGQTAAMDAGIQQAQHPYIVTMDGDRQNDPNDIPKMLQYMLMQDLDVVSGWRKNRKDPFMKRFVSRGANLMRSILVKDGIHDSGCSLKVYKKECFEKVKLYGEMHRFIPALLKIKGYKIGEVVVSHHARTVGTTKYNWKRTVKGFIDMISVWFWNRYSSRPLHLLGGVGILLMMAGFVCGFITLYTFLFTKQGMSETAWPLLTMFFSFSGMQLIVSGLIADIILKSYFENREDRPYSIKEVVEIPRSGIRKVG